MGRCWGLLAARDLNITWALRGSWESSLWLHGILQITPVVPDSVTQQDLVSPATWKGVHGWVLARSALHCKEAGFDHLSRQVKDFISSSASTLICAVSTVTVSFSPCAQLALILCPAFSGNMANSQRYTSTHIYILSEIIRSDGCCLSTMDEERRGLR